MKYDDLLNAPYKPRGRGNGGYDCYGLVLECCRRAGTPLRDVFADLESLPAEDANDYIQRGLNVRKTNSPKAGCIAEILYKGNAHAGYMAERGKILHATRNGVKVSPASALEILNWYEVTEP